MKANKQIGFIYKNNESIDRILKDGEVVFERGFLRERTTTTLPITFGGVGKDLKDYKVYGNTVQSKLPSGYTQVDYIESSGTQYIDTGVNADYKLSLLCELAMVSAGGAIGAIGSNTELRHHFNYVINQGIRYYYKSISTINQVQLFPLGQEDTNKHKYFIDIYNSKVQIDDGTVKDLTERDEYDIQTNYWICKRNSPNSALQNSMSIKVYTFKMYKENILVRDFIPCYRNSDNEVGLYDLVNNVFYTNQGTGVFTYGSIAPTPDAPIEMVSCGDRTKNLFDKDSVDITFDKYLTQTGETAGDIAWLITPYIEVKSGENYVYQGITRAGNAPYSCYYDSSKAFVSSFKQATGTNTITIPNGVSYVRFSIMNNNTYPDAQTFMIEEGSTATSYEPYGYKIPVNVRSENLLNNTFQTTTVNGVTATKNIDGSITVNGTATTGNAIFNVGSFIQKQNIQYTLNGCPVGGGGSTYRLYPMGTGSLYYDNGEGVNFPTVNADVERTIRIIIYKDTTVENLTFYPMIRLTETQNAKYQPYYNETTNIYLDEPLRKIDGYSDYIDFINGKVVRNIDEIILNGSENEWYNAGGNAPFGITIVDALITKSNNELPLIYCDSFTKVAESSSWSAYSSMISTNNVSTAVNVLRFRYTSISGLNNFKTWLSTNNVTVDYVLATPTEEDIELPNIPTIDGNNTLNIETEITPSQVYIKYKSNT